MARQDNIAASPGSRKAAKRVGRGNGSGHGTYSGRGCKGQKARAGNSKTRPGFEGGQLPLIKRLPRRRGFTNIFKVHYTTVSIGSLNAFEAGSEVTAEKLVAAGVLRSCGPLKVLADGELDRPLTVKANRFSASARAKIEAAGGRAEEVAYASEAE